MASSRKVHLSMGSSFRTDHYLLGSHMRKGGGHAKGAAFERLIAKQIVKAFKGFGMRQRDCWRSVLSGGHSMSSGDLEMSSAMEKLFPYSVECKFRKKIRWEHFLMKKKSEESSWVDQTVESARKRKGLIPILVMKANHQPILVLYPINGASLHPVLSNTHGYWKLMLWSKFLKRAVQKETK